MALVKWNKKKWELKAEWIFHIFLFCAVQDGADSTTRVFGIAKGHERSQRNGRWQHDHGKTKYVCVCSERKRKREYTKNVMWHDDNDDGLIRRHPGIYGSLLYYVLFGVYRESVRLEDVIRLRRRYQHPRSGRFLHCAWRYPGQVGKSGQALAQLFRRIEWGCHDDYRMGHLVSPFFFFYLLDSTLNFISMNILFIKSKFFSF